VLLTFTAIKEWWQILLILLHLFLFICLFSVLIVFDINLMSVRVEND